jgi:arylsulfatase A-like enzyme
MFGFHFMRSHRHLLPVLLILILPCPLSAASGDADNDGLRDAVETNTGVFISSENTGTNPNLADSDGDSLTDGMELGLGTNPVNAASRVTRPNIILINCDDMGYGDVGCFWQNQRTGTRKFATPHLDSMATQGAMMTHHYVGAPICASSRSSLLQGRHQGHADVRNQMFDAPLPNNHSIASVLKTSGYRTIHLGKAGLVGNANVSTYAHPLSRGFDRFLGSLYHHHAHQHYPRNGTTLDVNGNPSGAFVVNDYTKITDAYQDLYTNDLYTGFAKKTIIEEATQNPNRPFFLYLAYDTPHFYTEPPPTATYPNGFGINGGIQWTGAPSYVNTAINDPNRVNNKSIQHPSVDPSWPVNYQTYASMIRRLDDSVADILQTLRDVGIANNTLVVFTTDNGPESYDVDPQFFQSYGGFEGMKGDLWEGGIRVPTIVWGPGLIPASNNPANIRRIATPSAQYDWMATFADLAKTQVPGYTDGSSLLPDLTAQGTRNPDSWYYYTEFYYGAVTHGYADFRNHGADPRDQMQAIRIGDFMGVRLQMTAAADTPFRIYNVVTDPKQATNVAPSRLDLQQRMQNLGIAARRPHPTATRPYDNAPLPSLPPASVRNGVKWKAYEGYWPWLPEFRTLTPVSNGSASMPTPSVRSKDKDAGLVFEGYLQVPATGAYTFQLGADSNTSLWIHDCHVIDNNYNYSPTKAGSPIYLSAGQHPFRLYYRHQTGTPSLTLSYSGPGFAMQPVPATSYFVDGQPTVLQADTLSTVRETPITLDVLTNDTAENPLSLQSVGSAAGGTTAIVERKARYTPAPGFLGFDQFSYTVNDGISLVSSSVSATVFFDNEIWLPLDEGTGTSVNAYGIPSPVTGSLSGAADPVQLWTSGKFGQALGFDGIDDQVVFPALPLPEADSPRSFTCWLKTSNASQDENQTIFTYGPASGGQRLTVRLATGPSAGSLVAAVEALPGRTLGTKALNDGRWHHLALVVADHDSNGVTDITETKLYVDGQPDAVSSSTYGLLATTLGTSACLGGSDQSPTCNFKGSLDDVRIFPNALSGNAVQELYQDTLTSGAMIGMPPNDSDGDGSSDEAENVAGTDPEDPNSRLHIHSLEKPPGGQGLTLHWNAVQGRTYIIQDSDDLLAWKPVPGVNPLVVNASLPEAVMSVPDDGSPRRFFRVTAALTPQAALDDDGDGAPNGAEALAGTNASDATSYFHIHGHSVSESGMTLSWHGVAGRTYRVEESSNLKNWIFAPDVAPIAVTTDKPNASVIVPPNGATKRFVRLQVMLSQ